MCPVVRCGFKLVVTEVTTVMCLLFFFQAEDGIRDLTVTGVQTCALPISINIYTTAPDGKEKLIGQMDDPGTVVGKLGFGSIDPVSVADRGGLESRYAISADRKSVV